MKEKEPAQRYVGGLLLGMIRQGTPCQMFKASEPLPQLDASQAVPSFAEIANRFKIMCDLEPREYPEPVDGRFKVNAQGRDFLCCVHFADGEPDHSLEVTLATGAGPRKPTD
jgi:hypothetical protein